jgi:hypothetical protein
LNWYSAADAAKVPKIRHLLRVNQVAKRQPFASFATRAPHTRIWLTELQGANHQSKSRAGRAGGTTTSAVKIFLSLLAPAPTVIFWSVAQVLILKRFYEGRLRNR